MAGELWSSQYMAPGVLCAFAGASIAGPTPDSASGLSHAVRFRFSSPQVHAAQACREDLHCLLKVWHLGLQMAVAVLACRWLRRSWAMQPSGAGWQRRWEVAGAQPHCPSHLRAVWSQSWRPSSAGASSGTLGWSICFCSRHVALAYKLCTQGLRLACMQSEPVAPCRLLPAPARMR